MHLVQMLLPLYDNKGAKLPNALFDRVFDELTHAIRQHASLSPLLAATGNITPTATAP